MTFTLWALISEAFYRYLSAIMSLMLKWYSCIYLLLALMPMMGLITLAILTDELYSNLSLITSLNCYSDYCLL